MLTTTFMLVCVCHVCGKEVCVCVYACVCVCICVYEMCVCVCVSVCLSWHARAIDISVDIKYVVISLTENIIFICSLGESLAADMTRY